MINKNAFGRYVVIDNCLKTGRKFSLKQIADACENSIIVQTRPTDTTLEHDFVHLRKFFDAPIKGRDSLYFYTDKTYSIFNLGLTNEHSNYLVELLVTLQQFSFLPQLDKLGEVIFTLEEKAGLKGHFNQKIIEFDNTEDIKNLKHLKFIYQYILDKQPIKFSFQPYRVDEIKDVIIHPYYLKEYNRRWFLAGRENETSEKIKIGLDRIVSEIEPVKINFIPTRLNYEEHFKKMVGISFVEGNYPTEIILAFSNGRGTYAKTKPIHLTQKDISNNYSDGRTYLLIKVIPNHELWALIMTFAPDIEVIKPRRLRAKIHEFASKLASMNIVKDEGL